MLLYFHVDDKKEIYFILNCFAWILLMILNCVNSLSGKGIFKDVQESSCIELPIQYVNKFVKFDEIINPNSKNTYTVKSSDLCNATWRANEAFHDEH